MSDTPREDADESVLDKLRHTGVGTDDPNIIGDAEGGTDVAPGSDPGERRRDDS